MTLRKIVTALKDSSQEDVDKEGGRVLWHSRIFGSKSKVIDFYPEPDHSKIVEPFAGSARYAWKYWDREVWINDLFPAVYEAWKWIIGATPADIRGLPNITVGDDLRNFELSVGEKMALGFIVNSGGAHPCNIVMARCRHDAARFKTRLLKWCPRIKHWKVTNLSYANMPNFKATWFVDPPYQHMGKSYAHGSSGIDYPHLGEWCQERKGQVIVCEGAQADWLPFTELFPLRRNAQRTIKGKKRDELYYAEMIYHRQSKKVGFGFQED